MELCIVLLHYSVIYLQYITVGCSTVRIQFTVFYTNTDHKLYYTVFYTELHSWVELEFRVARVA